MRCLLLPTLMPQAAIVSKVSIVFTSSNVQAYVTKTDIVIKLVKVNLEQSFEQTTMGWRPIISG